MGTLKNYLILTNQQIRVYMNILKHKPTGAEADCASWLIYKKTFLVTLRIKPRHIISCRFIR